MRNDHAETVNRLGYSPAEYARLNGHHPSWSYRLIYKGQLNVITAFGRLRIPASEVERVMATAEPYNPKPRKRKAEQAKGEEAANVTS